MGHEERLSSRYDLFRFWVLEALSSSRTKDPSSQIFLRGENRVFLVEAVKFFSDGFVRLGVPISYAARGVRVQFDLEIRQRCQRAWKDRAKPGS